MNSVERVKAICKERKIAIAKLESDCGFSNGYVASLRRGVFPTNRLEIIAEYLDLPFNYLYNGQMPEQESTSGKKYYFNDETAEMAQELLDNPDIRMLFDAARDAKPQDLRMAADMLNRFKETNPNG